MSVQANLPIMNAWWFEGVSTVFNRQGVPVAGWEPIVMAESGGNPGAVNHSAPGGAYGLFQLERFFGQGGYYPKSTLVNPVDNAEIASPAIVRAYKQGKRYGFAGRALAVYTATHSGHPGDAPAGMLLPPTTWSSYPAFATEAQHVSTAYNNLTGASAYNPATGTMGGTALGAMEGPVLPASASMYAGSPWTTILSTLDSMGKPNLNWNLFSDAGSLAKYIGYSVAILVVGGLLIAMGLLLVVRNEAVGK